MSRGQCALARFETLAHETFGFIEIGLIDLKKAIADLPSVDFGAFTAGKFHLYKSDMRRGGSVYTKLASYSLSA